MKRLSLQLAILAVALCIGGSAFAKDRHNPWRSPPNITPQATNADEFSQNTEVQVQGIETEIQGAVGEKVATVKQKGNKRGAEVMQTDQARQAEANLMQEEGQEEALGDVAGWKDNNKRGAEAAVSEHQDKRQPVAWPNKLSYANLMSTSRAGQLGIAWQENPSTAYIMKPDKSRTTMPQQVSLLMTRDKRQWQQPDIAFIMTRDRRIIINRVAFIQRIGVHIDTASVNTGQQQLVQIT